jgi:hypothetical protein
VDCVSTLGPYVEEIGRVGGSRAQYEVIQDMLIAAYMKCGRAEQAAKLLQGRLERRPSYRDEMWLGQLTEPPAIVG